MATPKEIIDIMTRMTPIALATHPICSHMCIRSIRPSSGAWKKPESNLAENRLLQYEIDRDGHDDRDGHVIEQRWSELPLLHRVERRLIEEGLATENLGFLDAAVRANGRLDDHDALHAR